MVKPKHKTRRKTKKGGAAFHHTNHNSNFGPPGHRPKSNRSRSGRTHRHSLRQLVRMNEAQIPYDSNSNEYDPSDYWELQRLNYGESHDEDSVRSIPTPRTRSISSGSLSNRSLSNSKSFMNSPLNSQENWNELKLRNVPRKPHRNVPKRPYQTSVKVSNFPVQ